MLSPTEIEQQGAQQLTLKSTVVDFKFLFSYSLHIKTCFTDTMEGILLIILTSPFMQFLQDLLKHAACLITVWNIHI